MHESRRSKNIQVVLRKRVVVVAHALEDVIIQCDEMTLAVTKCL